MTCKFCDHLCQRAGKQRNGAQKLYCTQCDKYQQQEYIYLACRAGTIEMVQSLICESVGIRGISRVLGIAAITLMEKIQSIASTIERPIVGKDQPCFEVDELWTYVGRKENEHWVAYALDQKKDVIDFVVGKRTVATLRELIIPLLSSGVNKIKTDRLTHYLHIFSTIHFG
jgi:insertion element IS1 protein InsB